MEIFWGGWFYVFVRWRDIFWGWWLVFLLVGRWIALIRGKCLCGWAVWPAGHNVIKQTKLNEMYEQWDVKNEGKKEEKNLSSVRSGIPIQLREAGTECNVESNGRWNSIDGQKKQSWENNSFATYSLKLIGVTFCLFLSGCCVVLCTWRTFYNRVACGNSKSFGRVARKSKYDVGRPKTCKNPWTSLTRWSRVLFGCEITRCTHTHTYIYIYSLLVRIFFHVSFLCQSLIYVPRK